METMTEIIRQIENLFSRLANGEKIQGKFSRYNKNGVLLKTGIYPLSGINPDPGTKNRFFLEVDFSWWEFFEEQK